MNKKEWDIVIRPSARWYELKLAEVWNYRDLIRLLVRRDFVSQYKQTILGPLWYVIQPLLTSVVMTIVFGNIAGIPTDGVPPFLFYLSGTVAWNYFSSCLLKTSDTFATNAGIFGKVYFPRLVVPISIVLFQLVNFTIQMIVLAGFQVYFMAQGAGVAVNLEAVIFLPLFVLQMGVLGLGCGAILSSLTTRYRDLATLAGFGVQLWMYATPVIYPVSEIPEQYRDIYMLNPMASVVEGFRTALLGTGHIDMGHFLTGWVVTLVLFFMGLFIFRKVERSFIDTI